MKGKMKETTLKVRLQFTRAIEAAMVDNKSEIVCLKENDDFMRTLFEVEKDKDLGTAQQMKWFQRYPTLCMESAKVYHKVKDVEILLPEERTSEAGIRMSMPVEGFVDMKKAVNKVLNSRYELDSVEDLFTMQVFRDLIETTYSK